MGREADLFKAAKSGNLLLLEKAFASQLKKLAGGSHGSGLGSVRNKLHPNIQDSAGCTLLHHAILNGHSEAVSLLLKCGASTKIADNSGSPPLHLAAWKGDLEVVKTLVTQGPSYSNVNQQSDSDDTALHLASQYGYAPVVEFLLQRHADPLLRNVHNETPLDLAAQYGHLSCVHYLISYSPESLRPTLKGFSPLHLASRNGHSLVALSLINAGISINTVCERGTALHEAAMCGKMETVELLLDKGVNTDLRDAEQRTVLEVLDQFTADKAAEIRQKILDHIRHRERESSVASSEGKSRSCRVIAIARNTSQPLVEGSSALAFHTGDHIQVERSAGSGVYVGSVRGGQGSFLAEDVLFYTEQDGELVATKEEDLHMTSDLSSKLPDETTPPQVKSPGNSAPNMAGPLRLPHSDSISAAEEGTEPQISPLSPGVTAGSPRDNTQGQAQSGVFELSMSSSRTSQEAYEPPTHQYRQQTASAVPGPMEPVPEPVPGPVDSVPASVESVPGPAVPALMESVHEPSVVASVSAPKKEGQLIGSRGGSKKMSKKEKKFHLSKDDGKYAELNPINPLEAKQEYGDTLRLNPVGPAFGGVATPEDGLAEASPTGSAVPGPQEGEEELMGSYYVLEVGNFDPNSPLSPEPELDPTRLERADSGPMSVPGEEGYYLLNTDDPSLHDEDGEAYSCIPKNRVTNYINVPKPSVVSTGASVSPSTAKLHPHLIMANQEDVEKSCQAGLVGIQSEGRASQYENVCPPERRETSFVPVPTAGGVAMQPSQSAELAKGDGRVAYENVSLKPRPSQGADSTKTSIGHDLKRSVQQRQNAYEIIGIGGQKVNGNHQSNCQSPENVPELSVVQNTTDNRFAGLVITASAQLEESVRVPLSPTHSEEGGTSRPRLETLWDSQREEREWTQIDSLLEGMSDTIGHQSCPLSPMSSVPPPVAENKRAELVNWLSAGGLLSCASPLEVNGFDNLRFLGNGVLAMDDLVDIGITAAEDQYNLMAAVSLLAPPPPVGHASTVLEWLGLLDLLELEGKFLGYTLKKISTLWDIELTSVVGVELLGYRKRLQYGIAELRRAHPEWLSPKKKLSPAHKAKLGPQSSWGPSSSAGFVKDYRALRTAGNSTLSLQPGDFELRAPAEAQTFVAEGNQTRTPNLPSKTWKHENSALIQDCINYSIKYLGSVLIKNLHGNQSAEEACLKLRTSTENMQKVPAITLSISWKGVKFVDSHTKKVISIHAIRDISCCAADIEDKRVFAYISKDRTSGSNYSHVFVADSEDMANEIRMTLGQAFEICYQKVMRARLTSNA